MRGATVALSGLVLLMKLVFAGIWVLITLMTHFCCGLLSHNLLQLQKPVRNHAKMQLQQNAHQAWLQVTQTMMLF